MMLTVKKLAKGLLVKGYNGHGWAVKNKDGTEDTIDYMYSDFQDKQVRITVEVVEDGNT